MKGLLALCLWTTLSFADPVSCEHKLALCDQAVTDSGAAIIALQAEVAELSKVNHTLVQEGSGPSKFMLFAVGLAVGAAGAAGATAMVLRLK